MIFFQNFFVNFFRRHWIEFPIKSPELKYELLFFKILFIYLRVPDSDCLSFSSLIALVKFRIIFLRGETFYSPKIFFFIFFKYLNRYLMYRNNFCYPQRGILVGIWRLSGGWPPITRWPGQYLRLIKIIIFYDNFL